MNTPPTLIALAIGTLFWQTVMKQHAMVHALNIRHIEVFLVLGVGIWAQNYLKRYKWIAGTAMLLLLVHTGLGLAQNELTGIKKSMLTALIAEENRGAWACSQKSTVFASMELNGAKSILNTWLPADCSGLISPNYRLAQFVLFWR